MKLLIQDYKTGTVRLEDVPSPTARARGVVVATRASLVSAGTERQAVAFGRANLVGKARSRPDLVRSVKARVRTDGLLSTWQAANNRLKDWLPLGYSSSGVVIAVPGGSPFKVGDRVACAGQNFASHAEQVWVPENLVASLPDTVAYEDGAFATLGAIALHGIHRAGIGLGDRVAVIGLGLLGQLTARLLASYGNPVFGVDVRREAVDLAKVHGASGGAVNGTDDVEAAGEAFTDGHGFDAVIITASTPDSEPLALAARLARKRGRVCVVGLVGMEADRRVFYDKEIELVVAKSYGPGRDDPNYEQKGIDYPIALSRWTIRRNMEEFLRRLASGGIGCRDLIVKTVSLGDAPAVYDQLLDGTIRGATVLIQYGGLEVAPLPPTMEYQPEYSPGATDSPGVAVLGAGAFARGVLLPALDAAGELTRRTVAAGSAQAAQAARSFGFARATTDVHAAITDSKTHAVIIATRHDSHARLVIESFEAGKDVFVEKPLALEVDALAQVAHAARTSGRRLLVGFNRRFAPLVVEMRNHFAHRTEPLLMMYRVNAGRVPRDHWIRDPESGGGRLLGEVCHFIDTLQFIAGERPTRVHATGGGDSVAADDHALITLDFAGGSRGVIAYSGTGPSGLPKERIEVLGADRAGVLDNFRSLELHKDGHRRRIRSWKQNKGHAAELAAFFAAIRSGEPAPVALDELLAASLATLKVPASITTGHPLDVNLAELGRNRG